MMPLATFFYAVTAAVFAVYVGYANRFFVPNACERLERILDDNIVGQKLASSLFVEAVCAHLETKTPIKPLVLSIHGPPGVGKTFSHYLAARALYGLDGGQSSIRLAALTRAHQVKRAVQKQVPIIKDAGAILEALTGNPIRCPGLACAGYKVLYGLDFIKETREVQHLMFREAVLDHARRFPESLIVVEEYDKLDCETREMFRQILNHPEVANVSLGKSIIVLESNLGMHEVQHLMQKAGGREKVSFDAAYHTLKDLICNHWMKSNCGDSLTGVKFANLIDAFIPYFPFERIQIRELFELRLKELGSKALGNREIRWNPSVIATLMKSIQYDGAFAIDGAKDTEGPLRRVDRALEALKQETSFQICDESIIELDIDKSSTKHNLQLKYACQSRSKAFEF